MRIDVGPLPDDALAAGAAFHAEVLPRILAALDGGAPVLTLVFGAAAHDHHGWRAAAVANLARARAPARINAVMGDDQAALAAMLAYLAAAPGVTGQTFTLDGTGAGPVV